MIPFVLSPLGDNALDGAASRSAMAGDMMGRFPALSVTDMVELVFFSLAIACAWVSLRQQ